MTWGVKIVQWTIDIQIGGEPAFADVNCVWLIVADTTSCLLSKCVTSLKYFQRDLRTIESICTQSERTVIDVANVWVSLEALLKMDVGIAEVFYELLMTKVGHKLEVIPGGLEKMVSRQYGS
jgi:hypothetical protein